MGECGGMKGGAGGEKERRFSVGKLSEGKDACRVRMRSFASERSSCIVAARKKEQDEYYV